ncbi:uncharacterized protein LOC124436065 [Xenia sp. Carnegie-2017]|uniref:uncharacterized protein LOC124436065 n=1 Tax=Xenia sp. Carnegie-2017 TaxID=2897299 RepID=UPI001F0373FB|nr:uncharacterized protein LOC124436065 [Xenia sp. Carnegie-2017]
MQHKEMLSCEAPDAECITSLACVRETKEDVPEMSSENDMSKIYSDDELSDEDDFDPKFTRGFLDDFYRIRKDVTEKLKQFSWINGYCGITFNPEPRLYVTVIKERKNDEDSLKNEINDKFGWKASDYIDFRYADSSLPTFRYLSNQDVPEMLSENDMFKKYSDDEDSDEDDFDNNFTRGFLDDFYRIRKDVTEKLKQFSWINGYCGITFNPEPRLYVTVVKEGKNYEASLKNEINDKFGWKASDYIDFRYANSSLPRIRYLSNQGKRK